MPSSLPSHPLQEERNRLQQAVGELETSVEQLQQREAAGEGELRQQLGAATAENAQLKEQLAAAGQATEALQEQLAEVCGERQRLEGKVQKHKQVREGGRDLVCLWGCGKVQGQWCSHGAALFAPPAGACFPPCHQMSACHLASPYRPLPLPQDMEEVEERLRCRAAEAEAAKGAAETAGERLGEAEARERDLYEENKRLAEHIARWVGGWVGIWVGG